MKRSCLIFIFLLAGLISPNSAAAQGMTVEVLDVYQRPAEEIAPLIRPTLPAGGSVSAYQSKLIVKTTPQSLAEVRQLLKRLDTPMKQLTIQVRQGAVSKSGLTELIGPVPLIHSSASGKSQTLQNIKVLDGSRAMIHIGDIFPRYDITGFYVRPQLIGDKVRLELSTQQTSERSQSTLQAPLGQWVAVGGTSRNSRYKGYFIFFGTKAYQELDTAIFVKVDVAP